MTKKNVNQFFLIQETGGLLVEEAADALGVAVDGVKGPGEAEADDGSDEERREDGLLLPLDVRWGSTDKVERHRDERDEP